MVFWGIFFSVIILGHSTDLYFKNTRFGGEESKYAIGFSRSYHLHIQKRIFTETDISTGSRPIPISDIVNTFIKRKPIALEYKTIEGQITIKFRSRPKMFLLVVYLDLAYILKVTIFSLLNRI